MHNLVLQNGRKKLHWQTFLIALFIACGFFIPAMVVDGGYFLFYGDFNVQQVPFYQLCHEAVKSGNVLWNQYTDLGVNFIGSYTFYLLGSPFFLFTLLFPNSFVPYLMGPMLILKFALSALTAYFYINRFVKHSESAVLGGLLYAFSGFSVYNIFFNHFHEAIIIFPLLLLAVEMHIVDKRRGILALAVFLAAIMNYFFFYGMVVFVVIYWAIRLLSGAIKQNFKAFANFAFEAVLGLLMAMALLLPTILAVTQMGRLSEINLGYDSWLYGRVQIYANILEVLFFPPDIPARPVFFPNADVKWSSLGAWLPLFSIVGVLSFCKAKPKHWVKRILATSLIMALIPVLNSAFYMFNSSYYARWYYMPILIMSLCSVMAIEDDRVDFKPSYKFVLLITTLVTLIVGFWPDKEGDKIRIGMYTFEEDSLMYTFRFFGTCLIAIASLIVLYVLIMKYRNQHKVFIKNAITAVAVISVVYSAVFIGCGKSHSYDTTGEIIPNLLEGELELEGNPDTFRIDTYDCMDNTAMFLGYSSINAFHSIVPASVVDFYEYIGEERSVASRPETECEGIRPLLSVKYLLNRVDGDEFESDGVTEMADYTYLKTENGFRVYQNDNYIPMGFCYDKYVTEEVCDQTSDHLKPNLMVKAIMLTESQVKKYGHLLEDVEIDGYYLDGVSLEEDAALRRENACDEFSYTKKGFEAKISLSKDNLVFFSVPYDSGFKAYVNGKEVEIERVNKGFMAVLCNKGENEIVFVYTTPGLLLGVIISGVAFIVFIAYIFAVKAIRRKRPAVYCGEWPEGEELMAYFESHPEYDAQEFMEETESTNNNISIDTIHDFL